MYNGIVLCWRCIFALKLLLLPWPLLKIGRGRFTISSVETIPVSNVTARMLGKSISSFPPSCVWVAPRVYHPECLCTKEALDSYIMQTTFRPTDIDPNIFETFENDHRSGVSIGECFKWRQYWESLQAIGEWDIELTKEWHTGSDGRMELKDRARCIPRLGATICPYLVRTTCRNPAEKQHGKHLLEGLTQAIT